MASIVSYFWPEAPLLDEKTFETTPQTVATIPLGASDNLSAAKALYNVLKSRLDRWQQLQPFLHANLLRVHSYEPSSAAFQSADVIVDKWPTVLEYIKENDPGDDEKIKLCLDLAHGVLNLHNNNFAHGAIRADNVYVRSDGVCVLGQPAPFNRPSEKDLIIYKEWLSPEIRNALSYRTMRVDHYQNYHGEYLLPNDIYMLASTFAEIFTGQTPTLRPLPPSTKKMAEEQPLEFESDREGKLRAQIPPEIQSIIRHMRSWIPVFRFNADKTVDALLCPILARQRRSNYLNSKGVARSVFALRSARSVKTAVNKRP